MHYDGEMDIRGAYCAIACASICNIVDDKLFEGTAAWIARLRVRESSLPELGSNRCLVDVKHTRAASVESRIARLTEGTLVAE